jgi:hypothetical protein
MRRRRATRSARPGSGLRARVDRLGALYAYSLNDYFLVNMPSFVSNLCERNAQKLNYNMKIESYCAAKKLAYNNPMFRVQTTVAAGRRTPCQGRAR